MSKTKSTSRKKFYLDTSFLVKLLNFDEQEAAKQLSKFANGERYACYYTLIEFNTGLISAAIQFHQFVTDRRDVASAMDEASNMFSRGSKSALLALAIIFRTVKVINTADYLLFADQLESAIVLMHHRTTGIIKQFIGEYPRHKYSIQSIYGSEDFHRFPRYAAKNARPDLTEIWAKNIINIKRAKKYMDSLEVEKGKLKQLEKEFANLLDKIISDPNSNILDKHRGDFAISLEAPKSHTVRAYDNLFDITLPSLGKAGGYVKISR